MQAKLGAQFGPGGEGDVEQAELNLEFTKVTSLVCGIAGTRACRPETVGPSSILTSISQVDPMKAYFTVSEQVFIDFHPLSERAERRGAAEGTPLQLLLGDGSIYEHIGTISFADPRNQSGDRNDPCCRCFPIPTIFFRPGGYGRVRLSVRTATGALLIPQRVVTELQGSYQVSVVSSDNKVSIRSVTVADRVGNLWIVTDGLKAGERVIVEGLLKARAAQVVNVVAESLPRKEARCHGFLAGLLIIIAGIIFISTLIFF